MISIKQGSNDCTFIKRRKTSVLKKYKNTHSRSIEEASELSVYLYAVGDEKQAEELLESFCEQSPFDQFRPQRWEAVGEAILFNAYIKNEKNPTESKRLINIIKANNYSPIPGSDNDYLGRLFEAIDTTPSMQGLYTKHELCQVYAQTYLQIIYAKLMLTEYCATYERSEGVNINSKMADILSNLKSAVHA